LGALVRDAQLSFDFVATMLLGTLTRHDPHLRDRFRAATAAEIAALAGPGRPPTPHYAVWVSG
jgi:hypothetical protein